jgi:hypothetical protein
VFFYYACHRWLESVGWVMFRSYFRFICCLRSGDNGHSCDVQQFGIHNNRRRGQHLNICKTRQRKYQWWITVNNTTVFAHTAIMGTSLPSSIVDVFSLCGGGWRGGGGKVSTEVLFSLPAEYGIFWKTHGIPRNFAEFRGIFIVDFSWNSAEFRMYLHTEFPR